MRHFYSGQPMQFYSGVDTYRSMALPSGPHNDRVAVAHIRLSEEAMQSLRNALQQLDARPTVDSAATAKARAH